MDQKTSTRLPLPPERSLEYAVLQYFAGNPVRTSNDGKFLISTRMGLLPDEFDDLVARVRAKEQDR